MLSLYVPLNSDFDFWYYIQTAALKGSDHRRATNVTVRLEAQREKLNLPILPTTTIGSFPQTVGIRKFRREYKAGKQVSFLCNFIYTPVLMLSTSLLLRVLLLIFQDI